MAIINSKTAGQTTHITALTAAELQPWLAGQAPNLTTWVRQTGFTASPGSWLWLPEARGRVAGVLAGITAQDDPMALAHLPMALAEGDYALDESVPASRARQWALGWALGSYQFTRYRKARRAPARLALNLDKATREALRLADASCLVRDLVNTPTEDMGPAELTATIAQLARTHEASAHEIVGDDLLLQNFPTIHAVGRASHRAPRLIELEWGDPSHPEVVLVGKGVCFDSGGLDIKAADGMRNMKKDMGGAAHAIALARLIMEAALPVRLRLLVPAVENAIAGNAFRPGEIIVTRKGLSVEVDNTDAEGRLVLCDALALAAERQPDLILDFATLTGAARIALGPDLPALFTRSDDIADALLSAGTRLSDPLWRMPLHAGYRAYLDSPIADMVNTGATRHAGAITAALYLERFVPADQDWTHLDVYAWNDTDRPGKPRGGEAQGLRCFFEFLRNRFVTEPARRSTGKRR